MKLELLDPKVFTPEMFHNKRSYEAALYAVEICNNIVKKSKAGYLVMQYEQIVNPAFCIDTDGLYVMESDNCRVQIIGDVTAEGTPILDEDNVVVGWKDGKIWCTKKDVREYFKLWRICKIVNVTKAYDLTK